MRLRSCAQNALLGASLVLAGCSGGGGAAGSASVSCAGAAPKALCLESCSLGCSSTGCLRSDIAQNEIIILIFSTDVDPNTVSTSTIRIRTASGDLPVGEFFVNGRIVEFVPTLLISGGQTFFGFRPGETYTMTLPGGQDEVVSVRSTSGNAFAATLTCTLVANQGIKDLNGVPPRATLVSPTQQQLGGAPLSTIIRLEFNEMVDATPFLAATGAGSGPVTFTVRRTLVNPVTQQRECDASSLPVVLPGATRLDFDPARGISVVTFRSTGDLPANSCIEVGVTSAVADLAGNPAQPQAFTFLTAQVPLREEFRLEEFDNDARLDKDVSSGTWSGGTATFGQIGGDGRHGTFSTSLGLDQGIINGKRTFLFDTRDTRIPAANTRTGTPISVSDGRYFFDKMVVPGDVRLRFVGINPPQFTVVGRLDLQGEIDIAGQSLTSLPGTAITITEGQLGGAGGIFGGAGGQGGDKCLGNGYVANYDGRPGQRSGLLTGRAYAGPGSSALTSGGRGSRLFPLSGLSTEVFYTPGSGNLGYTPSAAAGGGGGGMLTAGEIGRVITNNHNDPITGVPPRRDVMGPSADGGTAVQFFPFPAASGSTRSSEHFVVGGAGGGGAGSHACISIQAVLASAGWAVGGGGGGGGGAVSLRAGDSLRLGAIARIKASGGGAASISGPAAQASPAPGGGGSGGSVVLQSGRLVDISGVVDVSGGLGGTFNRTGGGSPPTGAAAQIAGGNGSSGFVRCEVPGNPTTALLANMLPPATVDNVGPLVESDDLVAFQSTWYSTGLPYGPEYARYEIRATVNGMPVLFSDDPTVSNMAAVAGAPLRAFFQNANLDLVTGLPAPLTGQTTPAIRQWRTSVLSTATSTGIASDGLNGFRFALVFDRNFATTLTIDSVKIIYRV